MHESGFCHIKHHSFQLNYANSHSRESWLVPAKRTHQTGFKYTQVNGRSNKHRGDTVSASCPLLLNFPQTDLCCLPHTGNLLSLSLSVSFCLTRSFFPPSLSLHKGIQMKWKPPHVFFFARETDNEQAKCFWQQTGWLAGRSIAVADPWASPHSEEKQEIQTPRISAGSLRAIGKEGK